MSGLFGNNNNKNTQDNVSDGVTGAAKTGTGSKPTLILCISSLDHTAFDIAMPLL